MAKTATATPTLEVRRTIRAPRQRVFEAWTKAEEIKSFHAPGPVTVTLAEIDLRPGGTFRIYMREPNGTEHRATGVYREVDPPKKVVYTWTWEDDPVVKDSVVTVEFLDKGDATEVVLTHEGIIDDTRRSSHEQGWTGILEKLAEKFNTRS